MSHARPAIHVRPATPADLERVAALEQDSYPADEAASPARLRERLEQAGEAFLVAEDPEGVVQGFVCGTRSSEPTLTHASMATHEPHGASLCVHSVVVAEAARRRGIGGQLVAAIVARARELEGVERLLLICKQHLIDFYGAGGFVLDGPSRVVHGADPWFAMTCALR